MDNFPTRPHKLSNSTGLLGVVFGIICVVVGVVVFPFSAKSTWAPVLGAMFFVFGIAMIGNIFTYYTIRYYVTEDGLLVTKPLFKRLYRFEDMAEAKKVSASEAADMVAQAALNQHFDPVAYTWIQGFLTNPVLVYGNGGRGFRSRGPLSVGTVQQPTEVHVTFPEDLMALTLKDTPRDISAIVTGAMGYANDKPFHLLLEPKDPDALAAALSQGIESHKSAAVPGPTAISSPFGKKAMN